MHLVSIICPIYNEEQYIQKCINSIISQDYPHNQLEVFFVDGKSTDNTLEIIQNTINSYPFIHILENKYRIVPHALNIGIKASNGDVIIRIDGHCEYPTNYVSILVKNLYDLNADNVGAVWNTLPANNTSICKAIAICSSHKFGVGNSKHKVGTEKVMEVDTVPFGCYRRDIFEKIGFFDEELIRNQDDEFNARLINNGGKIFLIPDLKIKYTARNSIKKMTKMYYQYGLFKPLVNKKLEKPATLRQFFPVLFVTGIILGSILSVYSKYCFVIYISILILYLVLSVSFALKNSILNKDWNLIFLMPFTFLCIHISYGIGYLTGIYKILLNKQFVVEINR